MVALKILLLESLWK